MELPKASTCTQVQVASYPGTATQLTVYPVDGISGSASASQQRLFY